MGYQIENTKELIKRAAKISMSTLQYNNHKNTTIL